MKGREAIVAALLSHETSPVVDVSIRRLFKSITDVVLLCARLSLVSPFDSFPPSYFSRVQRGAAQCITELQWQESPTILNLGVT